MSFNVAIMGATGAVGQVMLEILAERDFPIDELRLLASPRSEGKKIDFKGDPHVVQALGEDSFAGIDLVLASAGGALSKRYNPHAVAAGAVVVDNTSAYRLDPEVPLVVPEINPSDLDQHRGIIANPNCSTIIMDVVVWPLHRENRVKRIVVSTYQAVSGAGARAMEELEQQTRAVLAGEVFEPAELPHQIAFNLFSHNSKIGPEGYCITCQDSLVNSVNLPCGHANMCQECVEEWKRVLQNREYICQQCQVHAPSTAFVEGCTFSSDCRNRPEYLVPWRRPGSIIVEPRHDGFCGDHCPNGRPDDVSVHGRIHVLEPTEIKWCGNDP